MNDNEARLDQLLGDLAAAYDAQHPPAGAVERLKRRLQAEGRMLSDNDLDWLAAAGPASAQSPPADDEDDEQKS